MTPHLECVLRTIFFLVSRLVNGVCRVIRKKPIPALGAATFRQYASGMEQAEEGEAVEKHV